MRWGRLVRPGSEPGRRQAAPLRSPRPARGLEAASSKTEMAYNLLVRPRTARTRGPAYNLFVGLL